VSGARSGGRPAVGLACAAAGPRAPLGWQSCGWLQHWRAAVGTASHPSARRSSPDCPRVIGSERRLPSLAAVRPASRTGAFPIPDDGIRGWFAFAAGFQSSWGHQTW